MNDTHTRRRPRFRGRFLFFFVSKTGPAAVCGFRTAAEPVPGEGKRMCKRVVNRTHVLRFSRYYVLTIKTLDILPLLLLAITSHPGRSNLHARLTLPLTHYLTLDSYRHYVYRE